MIRNASSFRGVFIYLSFWPNIFIFAVDVDLSYSKKNCNYNVGDDGLKYWYHRN